MKTFISTMRQNRARLLLLCGVLLGLFFSGGEGIRLLPFPVSEGKTSKIAASQPEENSNSYAFSVFSSRSSFTLLKSKFQKDANQYLSGGHLTFERSETRADFCLPSALHSRKTDVRDDSLAPKAKSKRAPPVI